MLNHLGPAVGACRCVAKGAQSSQTFQANVSEGYQVSVKDSIPLFDSDAHLLRYVDARLTA